MGKAPVSPADFRKAVDKGLQALKNTASKDLCLCLGEVTVADRDTQWQARQVAELVRGLHYRFTRFKSSPAEPHFAPDKITFGCQENDQIKTAKAGLETGTAVADGVALARELGDLPGNVCTPPSLATEPRKLAKVQANLSGKGLAEKERKELRMAARLSEAAAAE